jgi:hypothetical protein
MAGRTRTRAMAYPLAAAASSGSRFKFGMGAKLDALVEYVVELGCERTVVFSAWNGTLVLAQKAIAHRGVTASLLAKLGASWKTVVGSDGGGCCHQGFD